MLPENPEAATEELLRLAAKGGVRQVTLMIANIKPKLDDPAWEKLWTALEETGIILSWHITVFVGKPGEPRGRQSRKRIREHQIFHGEFSRTVCRFVRLGHPRTPSEAQNRDRGGRHRLVPWLVQELDYRHWRLWEAKEFWADKGGAALETKPSELFKRQIWATFQEDPAAMALIPFFGDGHLLWASDYPHPDGVWPNSRTAIERQMATRRRCAAN